MAFRIAPTMASTDNMRDHIIKKEEFSKIVITVPTHIEKNKMDTPRLYKIVKEVQLRLFILKKLRRWRDGAKPCVVGLSSSEKNCQHNICQNAICGKYLSDDNSSYSKVVLSSVLHELKNPITVFWMIATMTLLHLWLTLTIIYWPENPEEPLGGHFTMFYSHIIFMDLVPNYGTGYLLHKNECLRNNCHKKEHAITKSGKLWPVFMIISVYGFYSLIYMALWGLLLACSNGITCWHWHSAMWLASFSYTLVGLVLRLFLYAARKDPTLYLRSQVFLNIARFYWAHFNFQVWESYNLFGAQMPFFDVIFGTCPYDIPYSTPLPFVDFFVTDAKVFNKAKHPRAYKWNLKQKIYHGTCVFVVLFLIAFLLPWLMI